MPVLMMDDVGGKRTQAELYRAIRKLLPPVEAGVEAEPGEGAVSRQRQQDDLADDIRLLGALLGLIILEHEGAGFYRFIERLRQAAKEARNQSGQIGLEKIDGVIQAELSGLDDDEQRSILHRAVAAFRLFLLLAGIAEEYQQAIYFQRDAGEPGPNSDLAGTIGRARRDGVPLEKLQALLGNLSARLVFTAHPTKILRQTILHHQRDIFYILKGLHAPDLTAIRQQELLDELAEKIEVLWATQFSRWTKPDPREEISRILSYLVHTIYPTVPRVGHTLEQAVRYFYGEAFPLSTPVGQTDHVEGKRPPLLSVGSWVGGDMDGNPFVTPAVFSEALVGQARAVLGLYAADIRKNLDKMSQALHRVGMSDELRTSILNDLEEMRQAGKDTLNYPVLLEREPYRLKLTLMALKLEHTRQQDLLSDSRAPFTYRSAQQVLNDLDLTARSLEENGYCRSARTRLQCLKETVEVFGFHFASIDLREESQHINWAAQAILEASGAPKSGNREAILTDEILSAKCLNTQPWENGKFSASEPEKTGAILRLLGMLGTARKAQRLISPQACQNLVLTMASSAEDVLSALLLLKTQGLFYPVYSGEGKPVSYESHLDLVPLFETIPDLQNAVPIMKALFENPAYRIQLAARGNRQMVMVGYSDSNKDGGYFSSNWHIYKVQQDLWRLAKEAGVELRFFHGRGGNLGRGGGPAHRAVKALPRGTVQYGQDLTEQGEVLSRYYNVPETAQARCENLLSAMIQKNLEPTDIDPVQQAEWEAAASQLSELARRKYNSLVHENPDFLEYFAQVTPKEVELVKIGSRPTHRHNIQSVSDLRAIPWVFRWFQSRQIIPGWYGLGSALSHYMQQDPGNKARLQAMYRNWHFMESILENSEIILRQTDMSIARYYCNLAKSAGAQAIFEDIQTEYNLTIAMIREVTGRPLLDEPEVQVLRRAIELKEPYLDPLNYIQVQLLAKYRGLQEDESDSALLEAYHRVIVSSIEGIATGLGTSG